MVTDSFPFITCYVRIIDTITLQPITAFEDALDKNKVWDLGKINKYHGGISNYIIELDIWNNEPDISGGGTQLFFDDAKDCNITIDSNINFPFIKWKNSLMDSNHSAFQLLTDKADVYGNYNSKQINILHGIGDHSKMQFFVDIRDFEGELIDNNYFTIVFSYTAQSTNINIPFKCKFNAISNEVIIDDSTVNNVDLFSGVINGGKNLITIEAYNANHILQDKYNGKGENYYLLLNKGMYTFVIRDINSTMTYNNIEVNTIPNESYSRVKEGIIYDINNDIIKYINDSGKAYMEAFGRIINEYGNPVTAEIIIMQEDNVIVHYSTKEDGYFRFCIDVGTYDIKIRTNSRPIKITRDFNFDGNGLFSNIIQHFDNFNNKIDFSII